MREIKDDSSIFALGKYRYRVIIEMRKIGKGIGLGKRSEYGLEHIKP